MRQKKLIILFFYMALLAACAGIVWLLGQLNSPVEPGKPSVQESGVSGTDGDFRGGNSDRRNRRGTAH